MKVFLTDSEDSGKQLSFLVEIILNSGI